eukprot:431599-Rhodomonas_salina.2
MAKKQPSVSTSSLTATLPAYLGTPDRGVVFDLDGVTVLDKTEASESWHSWPRQERSERTLRLETKVGPMPSDTDTKARRAVIICSALRNHPISRPRSRLLRSSIFALRSLPPLP